MKKMIAGVAFAIALLTAPSAFATEAPVAGPATTSGGANCAQPTRLHGHRPVGPRLCRVPVSMTRGCGYRIDIKATSLRFATGTRRHAHTIACV